MALPTTNISLNAIHVEVGGTSGTTVSLNDADVRGIGNPSSTYDGGDGINTTSGTTISIGEFRGAEDTSDIPTTNYAQNNGTSNAAFVRDAHTSGIVFLSVTLEVRMRRADPYVYLEVRERSANYDFARWYNTSNTANTLSTTYVPLAR